MYNIKNLSFNATNCIYSGSKKNGAFPETLETVTVGDNVQNIPDYAYLLRAPIRETTERPSAENNGAYLSRNIR